MQTSRFAAASLAAFACLLWSSVASASFTASPDPASLGTAVLVGTTANTTITITHNGTVSETLMSLTKPASAGCDTMTLTPNPPGLPWTTAVDGQTRTIDVDFDPIARGARTCTVTMRDGGGVAIGTFVLNGTGVAPELAVDTTTLDFGGTPVAGGTVQRTFDIENNGDTGQPLTIDSVSLGGGSPGDYSLSAAPGAPIAPGGSFTMTVTFNPTAAGTRDATVTITAAGDPVDSTETVDLTGVGQVPTISHTTPDPMTFTVVAGTQSAVQNITLRNTGDAPLTVTQAAITNGGGWIEFTAVPQPSCDNATATCNYTPDLTLAPLTNQNVGIRCQPPAGATGSQNATVTFSSDSVGGDNTVDVDCTATKPDIMVSTNSIVFSPTPVVAATDTGTVTVMNVGNAPLTYDISITGANPADFTYTGVLCTTLSPCTLAMGGMRTFTVTFNPSADGNRSATMSFNSDDQETPTVDVSLMGVGTGAEIVRVTGDIDFGQVQVGTSSVQRPLTLRNDGTTDNLVVTVVLTNPVYSFAPGTTFPLTIPPTMSATVNIICTPTARQTYPALATANNNSYNDTSLDTNLDCQGVNGDLRISGVLPPPEASFNFDNVNQGQVVNQTFVLRNFGELAVDSITSSIAPANVGYTVMGVPPSLAPLTSATITVTFAPTMTADGGPATLTIDGDLDDALLLLDGNGLSNGIDTNPSGLDYGEVRWDQTRVMTFLATNTGESTLTVSQAMLSDTTNFAITQVRIDQTGNGTFETTQPGVPPNFVLCGAGDTTAQCPGSEGGVAEFSVRFQPEDTLLGVKSGMLTLICSLPAPDNMRVVTLTGISASPALTVEPGVVIDFGGVDLDGALPATQVLSLRNSGAAAVNLNVDSHTAVTAPFAATGFAPGPVAMGASSDTTFEYTPTVEQAAPGDTQVVTYSLTGLHTSAGPNSVMITLQGHGTDRHFISNGPVTFPPTYKNPAVPPEQDITVMNTGEAPLDVSALMLSGDPAFTLVDMTPLVVAPMTTATFTVRFNPTMAGTFNGTVGITHDDNSIASPPTSQVLVNGMGIDREMTFLPTIQIGTAIVGDELRRDDLIALINMSDQTGHPTTFTVRALTVADTSGVLTIDDPAATPVAPATTEQFGGSFTPTVAGRFETTLQIFLDQDPDPHGTIILTGHAVEVDLKGGGCAASAGGEAATVVVVLVLGFGLRRRRRAARHAGSAVVVLGAAFALVPAADADVTVQSFHPLPSIEDDLFEVESATVGQANAWAAGLSLTYARDPLISTVTSCGNECPPPDPLTGDTLMVGDSASLVKQQTVIGVGGAYAFANRFEVGLIVPIMMQSGDSSMIGAAADGATLGDIAAHAKIQFVRAGTLALGAAAVITAPTAKDGQYAGYSGPSGELELLASHRSRRVLASVNVGFRGRKTEDFAAVQQGSAVTFGAGAGFRVTSTLWLAAEAFGDYGVVEDSQPSLQALGGLRARLGNAISVGIGGGAGLVDGAGVPKARGFLLLSYSPAMRPLEPLRPPPPPPDTRDTDGDGIINTADKCPNEAEDIDLFDDADGCPDTDNDGDGVLDAADECASEPEDLDGFQDADGCPDGDNDGDGIADKTDVCPNDVEDKDGHADLDGCPDDDNDHDGVPDATDKCPSQPETINGNNDDDGCPDRGDSLVLLAADRIELLEPVKFTGTGTKLGKASLNLLAQVGATLRANPEIIRLRVTAHVHPRWTAARDQTLSDDRAKVVKDWLVQYGINADRIDARGFGSQKPLVTKKKAKAEEINDRIEFVIMEKQ
jgi:MYXO-CTERM domain-containing protein